MPKNKLKGIQVFDDTILGSDINDNIGVYDETDNYSAWDYAFWAGELYRCNTNITGGNERDLSNAPDISSNWNAVERYIYQSSDYPATEDWIFHYMELKLNSNVTITLPPTSESIKLPNGMPRFFHSFIGSSPYTATVDLNGWTLDGKTDNVIIHGGGYLEIVHTAGGLKTIRQRNTERAFKQRTFEWSVARNGNVTSDQDLRRQNGTSTSSTPYIIPFKCKLTAMSASTNRTGSNETWDFELWKNNTLEASLSIVNALKGQEDNLDSHTFVAGDEIRFRANVLSSGTLVRPGGSAFFEEIL